MIMAWQKMQIFREEGLGIVNISYSSNYIGLEKQITFFLYGCLSLSCNYVYWVHILKNA